MVLFHNGESIDVDNMIKPTCDALVGVVFASDAQLHDVHGLRRQLGSSLGLRRPPPILAEGLAAYGLTSETFVYLRVAVPHDLEELLR
jgi:hypothetical protein